MTDDIVVYETRLIRTMDPERPEATHLAVSGDRIIAVGAEADMPVGEQVRVDRSFADRVVLPGFIEGHAHVMAGALWKHLYVGYYPRTAPDGTQLAGCTTLDEVVERLREAESRLTDPDEALFAWGFDPLFLKGDRIGAADLDRVSETRPVLVLHASHHLASVNSALMRKDGIDRATDVEGVVKDQAGDPTGELQEMAAMSLVTSAQAMSIGASDEETLRLFAAEARNAGVTTSTDLAAADSFTAAGAARYAATVDAEDYPLRLVPFELGQFVSARTVPELEAVLDEVRSRSTDKLWLGGIKIVLDGSIQGFTARVLPPGYVGGQPNGIWFTAIDEFERMLRLFHEAGALVHVHCNGDEAVEMLLEVFGRASADFPRSDHRLTVEHSQLTSAEQYRRLAALGIGANLFANHIRYWGDEHAASTVGPERAARMNAAASALREGVRISLHSDAPVTPLGPLSTVAIAATRRTASGVVLGADERISVQQALEAVTTGAAWLLRAEDRIGSLRPGLLADLVVLDGDPLACADPADVENLRVTATVVGGRIFPTPAERQSA